MDNTLVTPTYRFRAGALDAIMRSMNLTTDKQLAAVIRVKEDIIPALRAGALVSAKLALHVSTVMGHEHYIDGWFELSDQSAA